MNFRAEIGNQTFPAIVSVALISVDKGRVTKENGGINRLSSQKTQERSQRERKTKKKPRTRMPQRHDLYGSRETRSFSVGKRI